jgi:hypothetical protein
MKPPKTITTNIKLPKTITIGGCKIKIQVKELEDLHGQFLYDKRAIEINSTLLEDPKELKETIRHEMVEAALLLAGVGWGELYDQEQVVRALDNIFWPAWANMEKHFAT